MRTPASQRQPGPGALAPTQSPGLQCVTSRIQLLVQKEIIPMVTTAYLRIRKEFPRLGGDIGNLDTEEEEVLDHEFTCHLSHLTTQPESYFSYL